MPTILWSEPAQCVIHAFDINVPANLRVGYISAEGEPIPDALNRVGINVGMLDTAALAFGDLSKYDAIVVGVRAYELRPELGRRQQTTARLRVQRRHSGCSIQSRLHLGQASPGSISRQNRHSHSAHHRRKRRSKIPEARRSATEPARTRSRKPTFKTGSRSAVFISGAISTRATRRCSSYARPG